MVDYVSFDSVTGVCLLPAAMEYQLEVDSGLMDYRMSLVRKGLRSAVAEGDS